MEDTNPMYKGQERPRGLTAIQESLKSIRGRVWVGVGLLALIGLTTMGLVIVGNEITKELRVSGDGVVTHGGPVATHQAAEIVDVDMLIESSSVIDHIQDMKTITLDTPDWVHSHTVDSWSASKDGEQFILTTTEGHELSFNGTHLDWNNMTISEVEEVEVPQRHLLGWKERFARKVKKKLDSPMCNTEALVNKFRDLKLVTAPACHVGVSAAKIYMHYNN